MSASPNMPIPVRGGIPQALSTLTQWLAYASVVAAPHDPARATTAAEFVKQLRAHLNLTQEEFAAKLGVNRTMVAKWETEVDQPSWPNVWKLLRLVGITEKNWRAGQGVTVQSAAMSTNETRLLEQFRRLPADRQIDILIQLAVEAAKHDEAAASQLPAARNTKG